MDCAVSSHAVMTYYIQLAGHIENGFFMLLEKKCPCEIFPPTLPIYLQNTYIKDKFLVSAILYWYGASKAV